MAAQHPLGAAPFFRASVPRGRNPRAPRTPAPHECHIQPVRPAECDIHAGLAAVIRAVAPTSPHHAAVRWFLAPQTTTGYGDHDEKDQFTPYERSFTS